MPDPISGATSNASQSTSDANAVSGASVDQIKANTAAAQAVNEAGFQADMASLQMNVNKKMGAMLKDAI